MEDFTWHESGEREHTTDVFPDSYNQGGVYMSRRRRSIMSEALKVELAKDLGFYDTVQQEGWGGIRAKDAGNMVKRAIELAERAASKQQ